VRGSRKIVQPGLDGAAGDPPDGPCVPTYARGPGARGGRPVLREARVFDVYRGEQVGEGRKSVAIHLSFQSPERTLTDDEAAELRGRIVAALTEKFGAELRA